ncbi:hypothetical protein J7E70_02350 [Variovorax paradoxus]|nr:hypothetical protein [Variovorax paradoxus]MBT2299294.1 hypothetical protein [Variovorax paradoxus]
MNPFSKYIVIGLAILLGLSALTNIGLTKAYLKARDAKTQALADRDSARAAATACSDATEALAEQATRRYAEAQGRRKDAEMRALLAEGRAQQLLQTQPSVPGDDCRSAAAQMDTWLSTRNPK